MPPIKYTDTVTVDALVCLIHLMDVVVKNAFFAGYAASKQLAC